MRETKDVTVAAVNLPDLLNRILLFAEQLRAKAQASPADSIQRAEGFAGALAARAVAQMVADSFTSSVQAGTPTGERQ